MQALHDKRRYRVVKTDGPEDLFFQLVPEGPTDARQQHSDPPFEAGGPGHGYAVAELALVAHFARGLVKTCRSRREGCARPHAAFTGCWTQSMINMFGSDSSSIQVGTPRSQN
jgi:hypothetical protein